MTEVRRKYLEWIGFNDYEIQEVETEIKNGEEPLVFEGNQFYAWESGFNKANEWHYVKDGDLPKDTTSLYLVRVYSWDFGFSHLYKKYGTYIPVVCEWKEDKVFGGYFSALDRDAYTNARNIKNCYAWKEFVFPE